MKQKQILAITTIGFVLTSCLEPQTYFSSVFLKLKDLYFSVIDNNNRLVMNYALESSITTDEETQTFDVLFFYTGIKLLLMKPTTVNDVATTENLQVVYDYLEGGYFAKRFYGNKPESEDKIYLNFEEDTFDIFLENFNKVESLFTEELETIFKNQATNLIIGGQPEAQDVKKYSLPIASFVDLKTFEDLVGFVPAELDLEVGLTTSTNQGKIELSASADNQSYRAVIFLSQPDLVEASQHLLTPTEKLTYEGYVA
jgi:hypothetical protein